MGIHKLITLQPCKTNEVAGTSTGRRQETQNVKGPRNQGKWWIDTRALDATIGLIQGLATLPESSQPVHITNQYYN
jgi:hypothetical protein